MAKNFIIILLTCWILLLYYKQFKKNETTQTVAYNSILLKKKDTAQFLIGPSCSFIGTVMSGLFEGIPADTETETELKRIMDFTGLPAHFSVWISDSVSNACAFIDGLENNRFIVYNKDFLDSVKQVTHTDWSVISILAHEVAHHLSGHTLMNNNNGRINELEADRFSGFILGKMGATREQALVAMELLGDEIETESHPAKNNRIEAISDGWMKASERKDSSIAERDKSSIPDTMVLSISLSELDSFFNNWITYQNKNMFESYSNYYSTQFQGIRRVYTEGAAGTKYCNQEQWLKARKKTYGQAKNLNVSVHNINIVDKDLNGITLKFTQRWHCDLYGDIGEKLMKLYKNPDDGQIYIVYEEMINSNPLENP